MKSDQSGILTDQALMHSMEVEESQNSAFGGKHLTDCCLLWEKKCFLNYIIGTTGAAQLPPAKSEPGMVDSIVIRIKM